MKSLSNKLSIFVLLCTLSCQTLANTFGTITGEGSDNVHCQSFNETESPHIEKVCFNYDFKFKLTTLMAEPVDNSVIRWYFPDDLQSALTFRNTEELKGIDKQTILNHPEFQKWLKNMSINGRLYIYLFSGNNFEGGYFVTDPNFIYGSQRQLKFSIPGSSNWDKLFFHSYSSDCKGIEQDFNFPAKGGFHRESEAKKLMKNFEDSEVEQYFCDVKVYGIFDLKHAIYKILEERCEKDPKLCPEKDKKQKKKKKPKVKDWFAEEKDEPKQKDNGDLLSKAEIIKKSTKGTVTDWFEVDRIEKQQQIKIEKERQEKLRKEREIASQKRLEEERKQAIIAVKNTTDKEKLEAKLGVNIIYSNPKRDKFLVGTNFISSRNFRIIDNDGKLVKKLNGKYQGFLIKADGVYLSEEWDLSYTNEKAGKCGYHEFDADVDVYDLNTLQYKRSKAIKTRSVRAMCLSRG